MDILEFQNKLNAERLSYLNSIIPAVLNIEVEGGAVYTEQEQRGITFE